MKIQKSLLISICLCCLLSISCTTVEKSSEPPKPKKKWVYAETVPESTFSKVKYGDHPRNFLDFWQAPSDEPTPLVVVIHGGGWNGGAIQQLEQFVTTQELLDSGISVASLEYRLIKHSKDKDPYVKGPLYDCARAVQFLRSKADEWNLDKHRFAGAGGSAGACTVLWLAYHDDLAQPESPDPIARESTRFQHVAVMRVQTTLDPKQTDEWIPNARYGAHAFGFESFDEFLAARDRMLPVINEYSPYALLSSDDPSTYLYYPVEPIYGVTQNDPVHSAAYGMMFEKLCKQVGVPCEFAYPGAPNVIHESTTDYLISKLK